MNAISSLEMLILPARGWLLWSDLDPLWIPRKPLAPPKAPMICPMTQKKSWKNQIP
jgi:hypothetical protein